MILYLDTSALVPLLVDEPSTAVCRRLWLTATETLSVRLTYVEAAAALARAERLGRATVAEHQSALENLDYLWSQVSVIDIDEALMHASAASAAEHNLRGYDAVHCAAAQRAAGRDFVAATGDRALLAAWGARGLTTFDASQS